MLRDPDSEIQGDIEIMRIILALIFFVFSSFAFAAANHNAVLSINTASSNISTSAYTQLTASTPQPVSKMIIANGTTSIIRVATGASGSEVDLLAIGGSATINLQLNNIIAGSTRIALEAVDSAATSGYITVSLLP